VRPSDEPLFSAVLSFVPGVRLVNARTANVDLAAADTLPLTGGGDIGADYPRQSVAALALIRGTDSPRDAWEFPAGKAFVASGRPILAICRGHQVLNGTLGGTLLLDIQGHAEPAQRDHEVQALRCSDVCRRFGGSRR